MTENQNVIYKELKDKILDLNIVSWEGRINWLNISSWLDNFKVDDLGRVHLLFLLSQFMYFGNRELRSILRSLFRDKIQYKIIESIRKANCNTLDLDYINTEYSKSLEKIRFLGIGNPSESGTHLLYYFRQENDLSKELFINAHKVFNRNGSDIVIRNDFINHYIFIDDFCGSGDQASQYSDDIVSEIKSIDSNIEVSYYTLFAMEDGLQNVRNKTMFDNVETVFELNESYKCFSSKSRHFHNAPTLINSKTAKEIAFKYGSLLYPMHPLGHNDCQLLIGFHHNIPDNSLPIIWKQSEENPKWTPIFKRYHKIYY